MSCQASKYFKSQLKSTGTRSLPSLEEPNPLWTIIFYCIPDISTYPTCCWFAAHSQSSRFCDFSLGPNNSLTLPSLTLDTHGLAFDFCRDLRQSKTHASRKQLQVTLVTQPEPEYRLGALDSPILEKGNYLRACIRLENLIVSMPKACPALKVSYFCGCVVHFVSNLRVHSTLRHFFDIAQNSAHPSKTRARTLHTLLVINEWANLARTDGKYLKLL